MRIIAGLHRGRKLITPADDQTTRPYTDRVKQALFDRLSAANLIENANVLDLFCGTGQMGLECLSRGARRVTFVDRDRDARQRTEKNLATFRHTDDATVLGLDALSGSFVHSLADAPFDLVFFDPPYPLLTEPRSAPRILALLGALGSVCAPGAVLIFRTPIKQPAPEVSPWQAPETWPYGSMALHKYRLPEEAAAGNEQTS